MNRFNSLYAIGDIHGCLQTLETLIETISPKQEEPLIFLGDYIDRGAKSCEVVNYLLELAENHPCIFLRGNHEEMLLQYLKFGSESEPGQLWLHRNGGIDTLQSYRQNGFKHIPDAHLNFFLETQITFESHIQDRAYFFVHGGLNPYLSITENRDSSNELDLLWERRHLKPPFVNGELPYAWESTVVCGHTPLPSPVSFEKLIAIDTGCVYNYRPDMGKLTAVHLPSRNFISVQNCDDLL